MNFWMGKETNALSLLMSRSKYWSRDRSSGLVVWFVSRFSLFLAGGQEDLCHGVWPFNWSFSGLRTGGVQ